MKWNAEELHIQFLNELVRVNIKVYKANVYTQYTILTIKYAGWALFARLAR